MANLNEILENVWKRNGDFCCLCFTSGAEVQVHVEDEVLISYCGTETFLPVSEVLCSLLGSEALDYLFTFKTLCKTCVQLAINSYNFIKTSKYNSILLTNTITGLSNNLENMEHDIDNCTTFFLTLNTEDFTSKQFYLTKKKITSKTLACTMYNMLNSPDAMLAKKKKNQPANIRLKENRKIKVIKVPISTKEMMQNDSDTSIKCKECLKIFASPMSLRNHFLKVHAPKIYKCPECNKAFGSPSHVETHRSEKHCMIVCSECGETFTNKQTFKTHEVGHGGANFVCHDCGRVYRNKATFKYHKMNVCGQKTRASPANAKYTCDHCNKRYTQKTSLRVHIQFEHLTYKNHVCDVCNKKFWAQSRLKAHMVKHTKEKNFICEICAGKFVTKEALLYHTRIHTGEKPYQCHYCSACFLSASRRSEHMKRQHANPKFQCDMCSSKFSSQNYLHKHKKSHFCIDSATSTDATSANDMKVISQRELDDDNERKVNIRIKVE